MRPTIAAILLAATTTNAIAQNTPAPGTKPVRLTTENICLEPGHPSYDTALVTSSYPTMRDCVYAGGQRETPPHDTQPEATPQNKHPTQSPRKQPSIPPSGTHPHDAQHQPAPPQRVQIPNMQPTNEGMTSTNPTARTQPIGPKGITLPPQPSYSQTPGLFRPPEDYFGRGPKDFKP